jgi:hypothetical protein
MGAVADEAFSNETSVRRGLRLHEVANFLVVLFFAGAVVALAAFVVIRSGALHRHSRSVENAPTIVAAPAPAKSSAPAKAPAVATAPTPVSTSVPAEPTPKRAAPKVIEKKPAKVATVAAPPPPQIRYGPPEPTNADQVATAEPAPMERPGGGAAKQMLNSIKCYDNFAFDREAAGRRYFSALCKGGNRMQVSCFGAGCKIVYGPPPSHVPGR